MINLVLKKKGEGYYFSNPKRETENEIFYNKKDGVEMILEYLERKIISKCKAIDLLDQITALRHLPICKESKSYQLVEDLASLVLILKIKKDLQELSATETETDLPKLKMCENCGKHGQLIGKDFLSVELVDKESAEEAVEELFGNGKIDRDERLKLKRQIENSKLPLKINVADPSLN